MPISLPPISRRHWLKNSLAASLASLTPRAWTAEAVQESWVLFSDTHVAADAALVARKACMAENLQRCVNQVLKLGQKPFGVMVNGDCVYLQGLKEDYETFGTLINPLREAGVQVHCTLGNHDDRKNFMAAFTSVEDPRPVEGKHVSVLSSASVNWVLLDSLDQVNKTPGILGASQLGWLDRTLKNLPNRPTFIVAHHNPQVPVPEGEKHTGLVDSDGMFEVLAKHKKVRAFIYGHTHTWAHTQHEATGIHLLNLPPVAYVFNEARPNGWVMARVSGDAVEFELHALNPNHEQHRQKIRVPLAA
ncbi:MAG TPA: metallophosphoesterase [Prosthecobacter sp.]|nr:metallophosphoesterase [Prosthecobacter sp.]